MFFLIEEVWWEWELSAKSYRIVGTFDKMEEAEEVLKSYQESPGRKYFVCTRGVVKDFVPDYSNFVERKECVL